MTQLIKFEVGKVYLGLNGLGFDRDDTGVIFLCTNITSKLSKYNCVPTRYGYFRIVNKKGKKSWSSTKSVKHKIKLEYGTNIECVDFDRYHLNAVNVYKGQWEDARKSKSPIDEINKAFAESKKKIRM